MDKIFEILSAQWLIHRETVISYLPVLISFLNGGKITMLDDEGRMKPYATAMGPNPINKFDLSNPNIPEGSVAVIPIQGVMTSWRTIELVEYIRLAEENPNIGSILLMVNSPGGMVFYTDIAANAIKNSPKPTVAVVMNMAASAAMWLISATNYRIATSQLDRIGSIGVKTTFMDINGFLKEKLNITVYDLYATKATEKDGEIRRLLEGDQKPIIDILDETNEIFHAAIRENLNIKEDSEVFKGGMFSAQNAVGHGLINEINTLEYALDYAYKLGIKNTMKQFQFN